MWKWFNKMVFKDQPSGRCDLCKWSVSVNDDIECECTPKHMTNLICLHKVRNVLLENISIYSRELSRGE